MLTNVNIFIYIHKYVNIFIDMHMLMAYHGKWLFLVIHQEFAPDFMDIHGEF